MKEDKLFEGIGHIDEDLLLRSEEVKPARQGFFARKTGNAAGAETAGAGVGRGTRALGLGAGIAIAAVAALILWLALGRSFNNSAGDPGDGFDGTEAAYAQLSDDSENGEDGEGYTAEASNESAEDAKEGSVLLEEPQADTDNAAGGGTGDTEDTSAGDGSTGDNSDKTADDTESSKSDSSADDNSDKTADDTESAEGDALADGSSDKTADTTESSESDGSVEESLTPSDGEADYEDNAENGLSAEDADSIAVADIPADTATSASDGSAEGESAIQTISVSKLSASYKKSALKNSSKTFNIGAAAEGKITCEKLSGASRINISAAGKVTVNKGNYKKGKTYKIKVLITAAETDAYARATKKVTVKVSVN